MGRIEGIENPAFVDFFKNIPENDENQKNNSNLLIQINDQDQTRSGKASLYNPPLRYI